MRDRPNHHATVAFDPRMRLYGDVGDVGAVAVITKTNTQTKLGREASAS